MIINAEVLGANVTPEDYNKEKAERGDASYVLRSHVLAEILRNARRWRDGYESPDSESRKWGAMWDCALLMPADWGNRYAVLPEDAPRKPSSTQRNAKKPSPETLKAIAWWDEFLRNHPGELVDAEKLQEVLGAVAVLKSDKVIADLIDCSAKQVMVVADWDLGGGKKLPLKCLIDLVPPPDHPVFGPTLWDAKSTKNASPRWFSRDAQRYCYHIQAAFYLDLYNAATGENRSEFGHVVQESFFPFAFRSPPPLMSKRFVNAGRVAYQQAIDRYAKALESGVWPTYDIGSEWPVTDCDDWFLMAAMDLPEVEETPE